MSDQEETDAATELAELQEEFDTYKSKTKDWQGKVRERDLKMRDQLKESTTQIREQEEEIELMTQKYRELEEANTHLRDDLVIAERKTDELVRATSLQLHAAHEKELEESQAKVVKLRAVVHRLEADLTAERKSTDGSSFFQKTQDTEHTPLFKVLEQVETTPVDSSMKRTFCLVQQVRRPGSRSSSCDDAAVRWFELPTLRRLWDQWVVDQELTLPQTAAESAAAQVESVQRGLGADHMGYVAALQTKHETAMEALALQTEADHAAALEELQKQVRLLGESHEEASRSWQEQSRAMTKSFADEKERIHMEARQTLTEQVAEARSQAETRLVALDRKVKELEEYKLKAQAAMKKLQQKSRTPPSAPLEPEVHILPKVTLEYRTFACQTDIPAEPSPTEVSSEAKPHPEADPTTSCTSASPPSNQMVKPQGSTSSGNSPGSPDFEIQRSPGETQRILLQEQNWALEAKLQELTTSSKQTSEISQLKVRILELEKNLLFSQSQHKQAVEAAIAPEPIIIPEEVMIKLEDSGREVTTLRKSHSIGSTGSAPASASGVGSTSDFNFDELLQRSGEAATLSRARVNVRRDRDAAEELRLQLSEEKQKITQLRYELREAALLEEKHFALERVLKDQLREEERKAQRTALQQEQADYVKNVVVQFIAATNTNRELQKSLVPVIAQLLQLSNAERTTMEKSLQ